MKKHVKQFEEILKLKDDKFSIGVEVPIFPDKLDELKELVDYLDKKIDFLNLNELEFADNENKITERFEIDPYSYQIKGSILGSISSGKNVQIFEKQSVKNGMMTQIWYRVKINGSYGWISKDVTTGDGEIRNSKLETNTNDKNINDQN